MSTRTIEPIHVVLPDAEGGYYRFGELPGMIADAMYPECPDAADDDEDLLLMLRHAWDGVEAFKKDLQRAAELAAGEPGYLHVVENSASKRPLEWRMGAVLNAGLVHLDWLNEWGESRKPPLVFSTVAASTPQAATPAPVADSASNAPVTPPPVATGDVAHAFDGLRRWDEKAWKDTLGSPPKWLEACIALRGQRGIREHHWNPVLIGAALVHSGHAKANNIRARFQTKPQLSAWLEAWKTYEADNFDTQ